MNWEKRQLLRSRMILIITIIFILTMSLNGGLLKTESLNVYAQGAPNPQIVSATFDKAEIAFGDWVTITVEARNNGEKADEMYISVSLPENPPIENIQMVSHNLQSAYILPVGTQVWGDYGTTFPVALQYPLVEGFKENWETGETKTLQFKVKPHDRGIFRFFVKTTAQITGEWRYDPQSGTKDQQNEFVYIYPISVGTNLLNNPSFEEDLQNWFTTVGTATFTADDVDSHGGSYSCKGVETNTGSLGALYQDITDVTVVGGQYVISGWIKTESISGDGGVVIGVSYVNDIGYTPIDGHIGGATIGSVKGTSDWAFFKSNLFTLSPMPSGCVALHFSLDFSEAAGTAWWDGLSLIEIQRSLSVPYEAQGNAGWCWAASTAMILRYYGKPIHVWDVGKTELVNLWLRQIESYIHQTYPGEFETQIGSYSSISEQTREDIEENLSKGYPVLLNVNPPGLTTHNVVVTGFNSSGFFINDPSGALFKGFESSATYPYIHEFVTWDQLQPLICKELLTDDVFLVIKGTPSPIDATLFLTNGEVGIRTIHDSDSSEGVCIDYGTVGWDLYWRRVGWHPLSWDSKDSLQYHYEIFNHKDQGARFDFHFQIKGEDQVVYYEKDISDILVSAFDFRLVWEQAEIPLKDYLIVGQKYVVTARINCHESTEIIDSVTLPPIYYGVKSIMFATECPVRILVTDPDGLRTGYDPMLNQTVNEIPDALYYHVNGSETEIISIPNQKDGNYSVSVYGVEGGTYNFTCTTMDETGSISTESLMNIPIEKDESQTYIIPEFPSSFILLLFIIATLILAAVCRRKHCMRNSIEDSSANHKSGDKEMCK